MRRINTVGMRKGRLVGVEESGKYLLAECDCGECKWVLRSNFIAGYTQSCGCLRNERIIEACQTHGHKTGKGASPTYICWRAMWNRCSNKSYWAYNRYGGRGISVDPRWKDFSAFLEDMGERPPNKELDRIDNNAGYSKNNCRWVGHADNCRNRGYDTETKKLG